MSRRTYKYKLFKDKLPARERLQAIKLSLFEIRISRSITWFPGGAGTDLSNI